MYFKILKKIFNKKSYKNILNDFVLFLNFKESFEPLSNKKT